MSVDSEISRLSAAKQNLKAALAAQGVGPTSEQKLDSYYKNVQRIKPGVPVSWEDLKTYMIETFLPVGSWWISDDPTSPAALFGGTWELLPPGTSLVSAGEDFPVGSTGGTANHTHDIAAYAHLSLYGNGNIYIEVDPGHTFTQNYSVVTNGNGRYEGGGSPDSTVVTANCDTQSNYSPYYTTYIWQRTA